MDGVALAANHDPVRLAEEYATLDLLSRGRVEPGGQIIPQISTW